jgi:hypothetical protein
MILIVNNELTGFFVLMASKAITLDVESPLADRTGWHRVISGAQESALLA